MTLEFRTVKGFFGFQGSARLQVMDGKERV